MKPCLKCKYRFYCSGNCIILEKINEASPKKVDLDFSGSSPPDLFVGHAFYPNVYTGILAPPEFNENASKLSSPESWFKEQLSIEDIISYRSSMIYSRFISNIKQKTGRFLETMQELSMSEKPCFAEFKLKKKPKISINIDSRVAPIGNPAPLKKVTLEENPKIERKVDYVVSDTDLKSEQALITLHKKETSVTTMIKLLSAGILGIKVQRKLVPTRFSVTAVDSTISKNLIKEIRDYPWINDIQLFHDEYLGNHYEILLLPRQWSFEVIELTNKFGDLACWQDYEDCYGRKDYASNVTGGYYAPRLGITEYLAKIKRQASVLVLREIRDEYYFPVGVGILREVTRNAFIKKPEIFSNLKETFNNIKDRIKLPLEEFVRRSKLLKEFKEQTNLSIYNRFL